ncbi:MAG TPA: right-handed parallel beta-helix repeat-containing protein [Bacteroidales bacterium]|nr:right-handed parallel beta-helix repeat-containing protein [Bacteroidales bacterium]
MKVPGKLNFLIIMAVMSVAVKSCTPAPVEEIMRHEWHYGPVEMVYEVPQISGTVFFVATDGDPQADGLSIENPTTIETAVKRVVTGDAIVMRGGVYRTGNLTFNQGIIIQPYLDEKPVLNGSKVASEWNKVNDSLWYTNWDYLFPAGTEPWWRREREERFTPMHRFNNDGVFIDGQYLQSAGNTNEVNPGTFFVDYGEGKIYIGLNPEGRNIEITAFRKAIYRTIGEVHGKISDGRGPVIRGLTITHYPDTMVHIAGYYPQGISDARKHGKDVVGTVLENNVFSNCFRIGVFAIGDSLIMRNNKVYNTNTEGVYIVASSDVLLERNIFKFNNIERWTGFFPAAVKIFNQSHRVVCRENLVIDHPYSNGIWYDVGNVDGIFVNNWIEGVGKFDKPFSKETIWPSMNGFFFEISSNAICAGNVFVNNDQGILVLNAAGVDIYNNTFVNSPVVIARDTRGDVTDRFGWHITTGPIVEKRYGHTFMNNILYMDKQTQRPMLFVWQVTELCQRLPEPQLNAMDNNVFIHQNTPRDYPLILWSPHQNEICQAQLNTVKALHELHPEFSPNCSFLDAHSAQVFVDRSAKDFRLHRDFVRSLHTVTIPEAVAQSLLKSVKDYRKPGAFPQR